MPIPEGFELEEKNTVGAVPEGFVLEGEQAVQPVQPSRGGGMAAAAKGSRPWEFSGSIEDGATRQEVLGIASQSDREARREADYLVENAPAVVKPVPALAAAQVAQGVGGKIRQIGDVVDSEALTGFGTDLAEQGKVVESQVRAEEPLEQGTWANSIRGALTSIYQQAPGMVAGGGLISAGKKGLGMAASLVPMGAVTGGAAYGKYRDRGFDVGTASLGSAAEEVVEVGTELLPTLSFFRTVVPGGKIMLKQFVSGMLQYGGEEYVGETLATLGQDITDKYLSNPAYTDEQRSEAIRDYFTKINPQTGNSEAWDNFLETMRATTAQTALMAGGGAVARSALSRRGGVPAAAGGEQGAIPGQAVTPQVVPKQVRPDAGPLERAVGQVNTDEWVGVPADEAGAEFGAQGSGGGDVQNVPATIQQEQAVGQELQESRVLPVVQEEPAVPTHEVAGIGGEQAVNVAPLLSDSAPVVAEDVPAVLDPLDEQAHEAATSPLNDVPQPTEAQIKAGNYKKGHVKIHGFDISIENPAGSVRSGVDPDGKAWETEIANHYGYLKGTVGRDKDHIDVFIGPNAGSGRVFIVDQVDPKTGVFDEHKVMMGFDTLEEAKQGYLDNYDDGGENRIGGIANLSVDRFKEWLQSGKTKKPYFGMKFTRRGNDYQVKDTRTDNGKAVAGSEAVPEGVLPGVDGPGGDGVPVLREGDVEAGSGLDEAGGSGGSNPQQVKHESNDPWVSAGQVAVKGDSESAGASNARNDNAAWPDVLSALRMGATLLKDNKIQKYVASGLAKDEDYPGARVLTPVRVARLEKDGVLKLVGENRYALGELKIKEPTNEVSKVRQQDSEDQAQVPDLRDGEIVPAEFGAGNKMFTADKAAAAREILRRKLSQLNAGIDPEMVQAGIELAGYYVEGGARSFREYSARMLDDLGAAVKPFLKSFYLAVRNYPGFDNKGMESEAAIDSLEAVERVEAANREPKRKKPAPKGTRTLRGDYGVKSIDGYTDAGEKAKEAFLKDSKSYLQEVNKLFAAEGWEVEKVHQNPGGIAGAGDTYFTASKPESEYKAYVTIGAGLGLPMVSVSPSGVTIMYRAVKGKNGYLVNRWDAPWDISSGDLVNKMMTEVEQQEQAAQRKADAVKPAADAFLKDHVHVVFVGEPKKPAAEDAAEAVKKEAARVSQGVVAPIVPGSFLDDMRILAKQHTNYSDFKGAFQSSRVSAGVNIDEVSDALDEDGYSGLKDFFIKHSEGAGRVEEPAETTEAVEGLRIAFNAEHSGIELHFAAKPDADTIAKIKNMGFKRSMRHKLWYAKDTPLRRTFAEGLQGKGRSEERGARSEAIVPTVEPADTVTVAVKADDVERYRDMGKKAFADGQKRQVPVEVIKAGGVPAGAWVSGWDEANIAEPVDGWTDDENRAAGKAPKPVMQYSTFLQKVIDRLKNSQSLRNAAVNSDRQNYEIEFIRQYKKAAVTELHEVVADGFKVNEAYDRAIKNDRDSLGNYMDRLRDGFRGAQRVEDAGFKIGDTIEYVGGYSAFIKSGEQVTLVGVVDGGNYVNLSNGKQIDSQSLKGNYKNLSAADNVNEVATNGNPATIESENKPEGVNLYDYSGDGVAGPPTLESSESASLPPDGEERGPDNRVGSSRPVDTERDGYPDESGTVGSGSVAGIPRTVHPDGPGERLQSVEDIPSPVSSPRIPRLSGDNPGNYRITAADNLGGGTPGQKIKNNLAAIRLVKQLEKEQRYATPEEQAVLARYVGWGGLRKVFDPGSKSAQEQAARQELEQLLTKEEFFEARQSSETAFYTSPEIISSIYKVLQYFGFEGGYTLEPTYGTGAFIGMMPADLAATSKWYGSELDPVTAKIGQALYPDAQLLESGFQDAEFPYGRFDLAIGNPPFSDTRITDTNKKRSEIDGMKTHNYVIAKSGMHLRPGSGVLAMVVTSRFLDTKDAEARDFLEKNYQFLGAIRLPSDAFKDAGTAVVTDMVFFRRLLPGENTDRHDKSWLLTNDTITNGAGQEVTLNGYFATRPHMMLGEPAMTGGQYGGEQFTLKSRPGQDAATEIDKLLTGKRSPLAEYEGVLGQYTRKAQEAAATSVQMNREDVGVGGYVLEGDDVFMRIDDDEHGNAAFEKLTAFTPWSDSFGPKSGALTAAKANDLEAFQAFAEELGALKDGEKTKLQEALAKALKTGKLKPAIEPLEKSLTTATLGKKRLGRIKGMLELREQTYNLIESERFDVADVETQRQILNQLYDGFVKEHGYINDSANAGLMADDIKIEFGLEQGYRKAISAARAKAMGVASTKATANKATILKERIYYPLQEVSSADSPRDGYGISLSERGRLDLDYIAALTGQEREAVVADLAEQGLVFNDPVSGTWIQEDAYLSGNVKAKLRQVENREGYEKNVEALRKVLPSDVTPEQIYVGLGATWVPAGVYADFAEYMGISGASVSISKATGGVTIVSSAREAQNDINVTLQNEDYSMAELFNLLANKRPVVAYDRDKDGNRVANRDRTKALGPIAKRFAANFRDWIMADPLRAQELTRIYNDTQNTHAERVFNGKHLKTVGANPAIRLRNSQRNAAWRMIQQQVNLLDHVVGAGKTFTIITGVMERKRLGLSHKPMVVVPNHIVGQWAKDFLAMYPGANILAATEKDFAKKNRRRLFSRIATGKFDAIVVGHSSFGFIPMEAETEVRFQQEEMEYLERALYDAQAAEDKRTVRTITNRIDKKRQRLARLMARERDDVATFESMGIDYLVVDESHEFKNLEYATTMQNVAGMGTPTGASKSFDLYSKVRYLRGNGGGVTFATGTPISNSLVEMYTLLRYLNYEGLKERDIDVFDSWAKTYSQIESRIEYTAAQKLKDRAVIMFQGEAMPELLQLYKQVADVVTMKDLKRIYAEQVRERNVETGETEREEFPVPLVKSGNRQLLLADPTSAQKNYMDYLVARATRLEKLGGDNDPKTDNHLWVMNDARKMALDIRLVDPSAPADPDNKVNRSATEIKRIYDKWQKDKGTQLVFCDLSTPAKDAGKDAKVFINRALEELGLQKDSRTKYVLESLPDYRKRWDFLKTKMEAQIDALGADLEAGKLTDAEVKKLEGWRDGLEAFIEQAADEEGALTTADIGFSVYDELKATLIDLGVPASEIRFIHDATTRDKKDELFAMVNSGEIRVLIGSSKKMGAGTNVQERVVALHHLDAPWRPSDVEQREGRAIRQGNMLYERDPEGFELEILAYSTQQTFDAVMWQVLARKAETLEQYRNGDRSFRDAVESDSDSYANFMAESTGNPAFKEKYRLEQEIEELEGVQRNVQSRRAASDRIVRDKERTTKLTADRLRDAEKAAARADGAGSFTYEGNAYAEDLEAVYVELEDKLRQERQKYVAGMEDWAQGRRVAWEDHLVSWLQENPEPVEDADGKISRDDIRTWKNAYTQEKEVFDGDYSKSTPPPKKPGDITIAQLAKKSEAATLAREIIRYLDDSEAASATVELKYGKVELLIGYEPAGNNSDVDGKLVKNRRWEVTIGGYSAFRWDAVRPPEMRMLGVFRDGEIKKFLRDRVQAARENAAFHKNAITEAERILAKVKFEDGPKLEQKRERYKAVVEEVNELEKELEERRQTEANVYISGDGRRFTGGGARFLLGSGSGVKSSVVAKAIRPLLASWRNAPPIEVVQSEAGLPENLRNEIQSLGVGGRVRGVFDSGLVFLVADNLDSVDEAVRVLLHEVVGHYGLAGMLGKQFDTVLGQVALSVGNKGLRRIAERYGFDLNAKEERLAAAAEKLAEMAERDESPKLIGRAIAAVRSWLREMGLDLAWSDNDILALISRAKGWVENGKRAVLSDDSAAPAFSAAWHGSPHDHDRFDSSKIGTGEGAQVYGYGLYFAGNREVAEWYKDSLSRAKYGDHIVQMAKDYIKGKFKVDPEEEWGYSNPQDYIRLAIDDGFTFDGQLRGRLYHVELAPEEDEYLLWDKPLNAQSETVKAALADEFEQLREDYKGSQSDPLKMTGAEFYKGLVATDDRAASEKLHSLGVRGIKYLDGASRNRPLREIKTEFLAELPEDAQIEDVEGLIGTGKLSPKNEALLKALAVDDWLGFDYPAQAISAALGKNLSGYEPSQELLKAIEGAQEGGNYNYVIFNDADVEIKAKFSLKPDEQADAVAEVVNFVPDRLADAVAPLGYRVRKSLEHVTSSDFREAVAWFFRNPFFQAEADPLKQPFYTAGSEREVNRMAVMLNMFGWEPGSAKERTKLEKVKDFLFKWQAGDKVLRWEQLKDEVAKLEPGQRKVLDLLFSQGDIHGVDYSTLNRAKMNPRIRRAEPNEATFDLYKRIRYYIDQDVEKVITDAIQSFLRAAGMDEGDVRQHISDYRKHKASRVGWLTRDHGDGDIAVRVYRNVKSLRFETRSYQDDSGTVAGEQALLPLYPGKEIEPKLRALAANHGVTVIDTAPGGMIFTKKVGSGFGAGGSGLDDIGYDSPLREFLEEAGAIIPEMVRKGGAYPKVLVYAHYVGTQRAADKLKEQVEKDYAKSMPFNYRDGEEYSTVTAITDKLSESMYGDMRSDMAVEAALMKATQDAFKRGELSREDMDAYRETLTRNTAEVLLGRAAGRYQIRRAPYLIEGYQADGVMELYQDYMTGVAGQITKAAYARGQFELYTAATAKVKPWAERYIKDSLRNMGRQDRISGNIRALASLWYMGFKVATVMINLSQPLTIGFAELGRHARWPLAKIMRAQRDIVTGKLTLEEQAIFKTAIYQVQEMETAMGELSGHGDGFYEGASKGLNKVTGKALALFQHAEVLNRKTMILAAYRVFRKKGLDDATSLDRALTVNSTVNFDMGRHNLPGWARNPVGRTFYALQSFGWNSFNYIYNRATSGEKEQMVALMRYMGMLLLLGGIGGWPLLDEFDKAYRRLRGYSFLFELKGWMKKEGRRFGSMGDALNAFIWHGLPSLAGVNVSNSMRLQMPIVSNYLNDNALVESAMGVVGGLWNKLILGFVYAGRGQSYRAVEAFAPEVVAGGMRAYRQATDGVTTSHGKKVFHEGKPMMMTGGEAALRVLGFQPLRTSEASAEMDTGRKLAAFWGRERDDALDEYRATRRLKVIHDFNDRLRRSQAWGLVDRIESATIRRALSSKANRKKAQWERSN